MTGPALAVITPSLKRDFPFCRTLNRSILEFLPDTVTHYIVVDSSQLRTFRNLAGSRTVVASVQEILPKGFVRLPTRTPNQREVWLLSGRLLPISGWIVQQLVKIAMARQLSESTLLMVDSDIVFVRDINPAFFTRDRETRLFTRRRGITSDMPLHVAWHQNACNLLGLPSKEPPMDQYVGNVISWRRDLVLAMCDRVEQVTCRGWHEAIARRRRFSEYILYGLFVEHVVGARNNAWIDERERCLSCEGEEALLTDNVIQFVGSRRDDDFAIMISSRSKTDSATRSAVISLATGGRVN